MKSAANDKQDAASSPDNRVSFCSDGGLANSWEVRLDGALVKKERDDYVGVCEPSICMSPVIIQSNRLSTIAAAPGPLLALRQLTRL